MVETSEIAYGTSWNSRRRSSIWKEEDIELYLPKPSEMFYMP
jgi:hypothetical protein